MSKCENHLSRTWFLNQGCKQVPLEYSENIVRWGHPDGYFLKPNGQKAPHNFSPGAQGKNTKTHGGDYPILRECSDKCHLLMARAFYGPRPDEAEIGVTKKRSSYFCHHLIPDRMDYRPANLLCWLTREQHTEADRRQKALKNVVPDGDLHLFTYERLRELQDPRTMSRENFEQELAALVKLGYHRVNPAKIMEQEPNKYC